MAYNNIQPASFIPSTDAGPFYVAHHALSFPRSWREPLLRLYRHGRSDRIKQVPIRRLNHVIAALAPDLISVATNAPLDDGKPWLYAADPYPRSVMANFIHAWLRDMQPSPEAHSLVKEIAGELAIGSLNWDLVSVDMLEQMVSDGGTAVPASHLWRLLPETFATRITRLEPYEHFGEKLSFRQVAQTAGAPGAELVSWPPLEHLSGRGEKSRPWSYSAYIRISLRTVPFSATPRINISTGVRRWVRGKVWMPAKGSVSVYLLADESLVLDGPSPERFAVGQLAWNTRTGENQWKQGGPEGMLQRVSALGNLPSAELMVKEPETWMAGRDGLTAAVLHHTMMGAHGVKAGIMPSERRRLTEWAAHALQPEFVPSSELTRSRLQPQVPRKLLQDNASLKKDATEAEAAETAARNAEIAEANATEKRELVAAAVGQGGLNIMLLNQSDVMRDHLVRAAEASLGLAEHRVQAGPDLWAWEHPELTVRLHVRELGAMGDSIGGDKAPRRGKDWDAAVLERRAGVRDTLREWMRDATGPAPVAFVELEGRKAFKRTADPKHPIRLGCADAGLVSQFLEVPSASDDESAPHRAAAAWADGLRQLGMRFVPEHAVGEHIPAELNQVAFWLVKRRVSSDNQYPQFTPIAVLIRGGQSCVVGRTPQMQEWVPYPELLRSLTGQIRGDDLKTKAQQEDITAQFIQQTLYKLRGEPTLAYTHAQNTRERWPWLTNSGLVPDKVRLGNGPLQRLASQGRQLRIVRVAGSDRNETPQWWAPDKTSAGISKGLWVLDHEQGRVFYSTSDKASQHKVGRDVSKFTEHRNGGGPSQRKPDKSAWNPELLELAMAALQPGDEAERWAMFVHQQRFADDYTDALGLPLVLHLASLAHDYALPHEDPEQAEPGAAAIGDTPEQLELDWDDNAD